MYIIAIVTSSKQGGWRDFKFGGANLSAVGIC